MPRGSLFPVNKPRTFLSPGYQDNLGWGFATALGAQHARRDVPVLSISGDGGFLFTANELATAMRHRIPLTTIVFADGAFGNVRRIQEEHYGNRVIASDLANPDFVRYRARASAPTAERARNPQELRAALKRAFKRRDGPTLIEVPVGPMPSPWEFIHMPRIRGSVGISRRDRPLSRAKGAEKAMETLAPTTPREIGERAPLDHPAGRCHPGRTCRSKSRWRWPAAPSASALNILVRIEARTAPSAGAKRLRRRP